MSKIFYDGDVIIIQGNELYINGNFEDYTYSLSDVWDTLENYYGKDQCVISLYSIGTLCI